MTTPIDTSPEAVAEIERKLYTAHLFKYPQTVCDTAVHMLRALAAERDALRSALTASEKDAARYRWLREHRYTDFPGKGNPRFMIGADMDAAIDAAMEKAK